MSINGHSTGSFDQAPIAGVNGKPSHDFLGSPFHDRGAFSYFNAWDIFNNSFNQITFARHLQRIDIGTNFHVTKENVNTRLCQIRGTWTGIDLIPPGIYGAIFCREVQPVGSDIADQFCARLVGANGVIANISAPNNTDGYDTLPPGIISQESDAALDGSGGLVQTNNWGALNLPPIVTNSGFHWFYVFNSRLLLGSDTAFRPQYIQPLALSVTAFSDEWSPSLANLPYRNFYSVPFTTVLGYYRQSAAPSYPPKFNRPYQPSDLAGFPPQFLPSGVDGYPYE